LPHPHREQNPKLARSLNPQPRFSLISFILSPRFQREPTDETDLVLLDRRERRRRCEGLKTQLLHLGSNRIRGINALGAVKALSDLPLNPHTPWRLDTLDEPIDPLLSKSRWRIFSYVIGSRFHPGRNERASASSRGRSSWSSRNVIYRASRGGADTECGYRCGRNVSFLVQCSLPKSSTRQTFARKLSPSAAIAGSTSQCASA
jgi:hypothetical protein